MQSILSLCFTIFVGCELSTETETARLENGGVNTLLLEKLCHMEKKLDKMNDKIDVACGSGKVIRQELAADSNDWRVSCGVTEEVPRNEKKRKKTIHGAIY